MKHKYMKYQVQFLPALRSLLRWYEKGDNKSEVNPCPLCRIATSTSYAAGNSGCDACPWLIFAGHQCTVHNYTSEEFAEIGNAEELKDVNYLRDERHPGFAKWRIKNIRNWIKQIEEYEKSKNECSVLEQPDACRTEE